MRTMNRDDLQLHGECTGSFEPYQPLKLAPSLVAAPFLARIERARCQPPCRLGYSCALIDERLHVVTQPAPQASRQECGHEIAPGSLQKCAALLPDLPGEAERRPRRDEALAIAWVLLRRCRKS